MGYMGLNDLFFRFTRTFFFFIGNLLVLFVFICFSYDDYDHDQFDFVS
jgi:hypothetical protein